MIPTPTHLGISPGIIALIVATAIAQLTGWAVQCIAWIEKQVSRR